MRLTWREVRPLAGQQGDSMPVGARRPAFAIDNEKELGKPRGMLANAPPGLDVDAVHVRFPLTAPDSDVGGGNAVKELDRPGMVAGEG